MNDEELELSWNYFMCNKCAKVYKIAQQYLHKCDKEK